MGLVRVSTSSCSLFSKLPNNKRACGGDTNNPRRRNDLMHVLKAGYESKQEEDIRKANLFAKRKERVRLPDNADGYGSRAFPVSEFLCHPSGVEAILNTRSLQCFHSLDCNTYRCTLQKVQFLNFEVVPVVDLRVTPTSEYCIIEMLCCKFEGSEIFEQQNHRFSAFMRNQITWEENSSESFVDFDVELSVTLEVYTKPFSLLPISAVESPGNLIMQGLIDKLVPLLVQQLLEDYRAWVEEEEQSKSSSSSYYNEKE